MQPAKRMKILVCAHEFSPAEGSECSGGWNIVTRLARYHDVTVLCASGSHRQLTNYRQAVDNYLATQGAVDGLRFAFVDQPLAARLYAWMNRLMSGMRDGVGFRPLAVAALKAWHRRAYKRACQLGADQFDIVHHLNPVAYWGAGYLWNLGRPYLWGPMSGMGGSSLAFGWWLGGKYFMFELCRAVYNRIMSIASWRFRRGIKAASVIWTVGAEDAAMIRSMGGKNVMPMLDFAASTGCEGHVRDYDGVRPLRLCWAGQHVCRKALPLLLHAIAASSVSKRVELHVLNDGPETSRWKALAQELGLEQVVWHGRFPDHRDALAEMGRADVFVHTSIREATSAVILEALGHGIPVVCHGICGMAVVINDECGIKIPLVSPQQSIDGFRKAIEAFVEKPCLVESLSAGAMKRASELNWEANVAEMVAAYERCVHV